MIRGWYDEDVPSVVLFVTPGKRPELSNVVYLHPQGDPLLPISCRVHFIYQMTSEGGVYDHGKSVDGVERARCQLFRV